MECKFCKEKCRRAGRQQNGQQRYYCKGCNKYQQVTYKYLACDPKTAILLPGLVREGVGIRGIGRLLKMGITTVLRRIKKMAAAIVQPPMLLNLQSVELDEVITYVGKKEHQYWVAYALCSETKRVIDFVVGKRSKEVLRSIVNTLISTGVKKIKTDRLNIYRSLIPKDKHVSKAYNINHIERNNLNLRTHLKRLSRRTICYSKSVEMLEACLRIYFWKG